MKISTSENARVHFICAYFILICYFGLNCEQIQQRARKKPPQIETASSAFLQIVLHIFLHLCPFFLFSLCSLIIGTTLTTTNMMVIIKIIKVDNALMDGFTRLLMVYTKIEMLLTPLRLQNRRDKIIKGHGKGNQRPGDNPRHNLRHDNLNQRLPGCCAQIQCCVSQIGI